MANVHPCEWHNDVIHAANDNLSVRRHHNFIKTLQLKIGCYACTIDGNIVKDSFDQQSKIHKSQ